MSQVTNTNTLRLSRVECRATVLDLGQGRCRIADEHIEPHFQVEWLQNRPTLIDHQATPRIGGARNLKLQVRHVECVLVVQSLVPIDRC